MRGRYSEDDDAGMDNRRHGHHGDDSSDDGDNTTNNSNNNGYDRSGPGQESAGFLSGGNPAGHNEFRFSSFGGAPVNAPDGYGEPGGGGGGGGGGPLGGIRLGRRLQRWGQGIAAAATGQDAPDPHHQQNAPATDYGNSLLPGESRSVRALGQVNNLTMIREGALQRISNLHLGERIWGPSLDLNQLIMREDWGLAAMQCKMRPHLAGKWLERSGFFMGRHNASVLPLHQCCALRPPVEMIQTLVITYPAGVKAKETSFGRLPLHVACRSGGSPEAVECLLAYHPDGTQEGDNLKRIPLHYALKNDAGAEVVRLLMDAYPEGVSCADHRGWIPLHVACSMGTDLSIIETLLEDYPETVLMKTHKGSDCIRCAKMSKGHPNEDAICRFMEEKMAKAEGRTVGDDGDDGDDGTNEEEEEEKKEAVADDSDDESHHQDDDEVDLFDLGGSADVGEAVGGEGEGDLLGLSSDTADNKGDETKAEDLLLDVDAADPQELASTSTRAPEVENDAAPEPEALPPMPASAPPPEPQSARNDGAGNESAPLAFMPTGMTEESPTSTADADFLSMTPVDQDLKAGALAPDMLGDIVLEEGSADVVKALEGNLIDL